MMTKRQKGVTQVEFIIIATTVLLLLFAILEFAAYFYSTQMVNEVTRRAARLAAVCHISDRDDIPQLGSLTALYPAGFTADNIEISYLDADGEAVDVSGFLTTPPADSATLQAQFDQVRYVQARAINYNYNFVVLSTLLSITGNTPSFETILPAESLGILRQATSTGDVRTDC
ncbi:pilus assembly protein [Vibrio sp. 404]|uniref:Pilus assembly protein n=1 Tax=Vibrio marinisediminis TaxID=2758441 RepID=A0A7W2ITC1_9VIBR|nr:TadE family protein [Vibrio marinisediminis]MBA5762310.1 pilus assembly protein [Vibrio marinisediminis]